MRVENDILIVAYGSNLNLNDFDNFAKSQGYFGTYLKYFKKVMIPDYKLVFNVNSLSRKGGVLNIKYSIGFLTQAVIFKTNEVGIKILKIKEGVPFKYQLKQIYVIDDRGKEFSALAFVVPNERTFNFVAPHKRYLDICLKGYKDFNLSYGKINLIKASLNHEIKPLDSLFCYGTLMREEIRFPLIKDRGIYNSITGYCKIGYLSTNGLYPALNINTEINKKTKGDFFQFKNISQVIKITDKIENFYGYKSKNNLFKRSYTKIDVEGKSKSSWIYVADMSFKTKIKDWKDYKKKND